MLARGLGANVIVTEIDPVKAIEAKMDGYTVLSMDEAARIGDIFVTVTGCNKVITIDQIRSMKEGAVLANAGHFNVEIDMPDVEKHAVAKKTVRENVVNYRFTRSGDSSTHGLSSISAPLANGQNLTDGLIHQHLRPTRLFLATVSV